MGRERIYLGRRGEAKASQFLAKRGYRIVAANYRTPAGEIDLVARHNGTLVFVEIKTRASSSLGPPHLSVTRAKERRIIRNALFYLKNKKLDDVSWRIDIVSVRLDQDYEVEDIELIENAVEERI
jgi:putative endonuclease